MKELKEEEKFIIGQALGEVHSSKDIEIVKRKVEGTVVGINKKAMETFVKLASMKVKAFALK